ncbi:hypothetical protein ROS1_27560 [Roseibium sp. ROS1]
MSEKRAKPDQFQLRMPPGLRDRIKIYAELHGRSMNEEIVRLLEREFPEPWNVDSRISDLLKMLLVIRKGGSDDRIIKLANELEETVRGIITGQVGGVDDEAIAAMDWRWQRYLEERMEDDRGLLNLDEEEEEQLSKSGTTAKFINVEEPARLERIKSLFPDLSDEHLKLISGAVEGGSVEKVLETVGSVVHRQKLEQQAANSPTNIDDDLPF